MLMQLNPSFPTRLSMSRTTPTLTGTTTVLLFCAAAAKTKKRQEKQNMIFILFCIPIGLEMNALGFNRDGVIYMVCSCHVYIRQNLNFYIKKRDRILIVFMVRGSWFMIGTWTIGSFGAIYIFIIISAKSHSRINYIWILCVRIFQSI